MAALLLAELQELTRVHLEMSTAPGGRIVVYARTERPLSVRRIRQLAMQHGKSVSFRLGSEPQIIFEDVADDVSLPSPLEQLYGSGDFSIKLSKPPVKIAKLGVKSAGSTDVYVIQIPCQTVTSASIDEWLKRPKSLDIHIGKGELRMLVAQPSLSTLSIGRLLRSGQLHVSTRRRGVGAGKRRRRRSFCRPSNSA